MISDFDSTLFNDRVRSNEVRKLKHVRNYSTDNQNIYNQKYSKLRPADSTEISYAPDRRWLYQHRDLTFTSNNHILCLTKQIPSTVLQKVRNIVFHEALEFFRADCRIIKRILRISKTLDSIKVYNSMFFGLRYFSMVLRYSSFAKNCQLFETTRSSPYLSFAGAYRAFSNQDENFPFGVTQAVLDLFAETPMPYSLEIQSPICRRIGHIKVISFRDVNGFSFPEDKWSTLSKFVHLREIRFLDCNLSLLPWICSQVETMLKFMKSLRVVNFTLIQNNGSEEMSLDRIVNILNTKSAARNAIQFTVNISPNFDTCKNLTDQLFSCAEETTNFPISEVALKFKLVHYGDSIKGNNDYFSSKLRYDSCQQNELCFQRIFIISNNSDIYKKILRFFYKGITSLCLEDQSESHKLLNYFYENHFSLQAIEKLVLESSYNCKSGVLEVKKSPFLPRLKKLELCFYGNFQLSSFKFKDQVQNLKIFLSHCRTLTKLKLSLRLEHTLENLDSLIEWLFDANQHPRFVKFKIAFRLGKSVSEKDLSAAMRMACKEWLTVKLYDEYDSIGEYVDPLILFTRLAIRRQNAINQERNMGIMLEFTRCS